MNKSTEQIFDIYDVWYEPLLTQTWFIITLILILIIFIGLVLYYIYTRYFNKPIEIDPLVVITDRLTYLHKISIENEQDGKQIYFELTKLMKEYIVYRYHISVMGLTDREIIEWAYLVIPEDEIIILKQLFLDLAPIKFENQMTTTEQLHKDIELMQNFIKKTTPVHTH